jgi:hypothetical protein
MRPATKTVHFGDLVAAAFDEAGRHCDDPREVSCWAIHVVEHALIHARRTGVSHSIVALGSRAKYLPPAS